MASNYMLKRMQTPSPHLAITNGEDRTHKLRELCGIRPLYTERFKFWSERKIGSTITNEVAYFLLTEGFTKQGVSSISRIVDGQKSYDETMAMALEHTSFLLTDVRAACLTRMHDFYASVLHVEGLTPVEQLLKKIQPKEEPRTESQGRSFKEAKDFRDKIFANSSPDYSKRYTEWGGHTHALAIYATNVIFEFMESKNIHRLDDILRPREFCQQVQVHVLEKTQGRDTNEVSSAKSLSSTIVKVFAEVIAPDEYTFAERKAMKSGYVRKHDQPTP